MKKNAAIIIPFIISSVLLTVLVSGLRVNKTRPKQAGTAFNMP